MPSENPLRCAHYMHRKKRNCNLASIPPSLFCTIHTPSYADSGVPCPYCSTTLKRSGVDSHVRICPKALELARLEGLPCYVRDINLSEPPKPLAELPVDTSIASKAAAELHAILATQDLWRPVGVSVPESDHIRVRWDNARDSSVRYEETYFTQSSALVALAFGPSPGAADRMRVGVVEFGAGRAYTSLLFAEILRMRRMAADIVIIDRENPRLGADRAMRAFERDSQLDKIPFSFTRLKYDLKDLHLDAVDSVDKSDHIFFVGKHVCGSALDLALVCMTRFVKSRKGKSISFALASCCRHRCCWQAAPSAQPIWTQQWNISETLFGHICRMSGWCLGCTSLDESILTGTKCQELVDAARVLWLRNQGWDAHLVRYVDKTVSPENIALVGSWRQR